jgi:hypothetical protein
MGEYISVHISNRKFYQKQIKTPANHYAKEKCASNLNHQLYFIFSVRHRNVVKPLVKCKIKIKISK